MPAGGFAIPGNFALVLLGGEISDTSFLADLAASACCIVCADSGAEYANALQLNVDAIVGDFDSISQSTLEYFRAKGTKIVRIPEQNSNDFEKALRHLSTTFHGHVKVLGVTGKRTDHTLANFSVMLRFTDRFDSVMAYDETADHRFLTKKHPQCSIECPFGTTISLVPFGTASGITTVNLQWPLSSDTLLLGEREGLSNVAIGSPVEIRIEDGALLVTVNREA
ncbi:MAG TPA: thiamine diphosphokinase [Candidatus Kapabacteria bacterium]|jgi:thiamine pyrophosphokinase|nr:thiamine diphosphokinase [Candidatus Kapabacteria bacterium]